MYAALSWLPLDDATDLPPVQSCNASRQMEATPAHRRVREEEERFPKGHANPFVKEMS